MVTSRGRGGQRGKGWQRGGDQLKASGSAAPQHPDPISPHLSEGKALGQILTLGGPGTGWGQHMLSLPVKYWLESVGKGQDGR